MVGWFWFVCVSLVFSVPAVASAAGLSAAPCSGCSLVGFGAAAAFGSAFTAALFFTVSGFGFGVLFCLAIRVCFFGEEILFVYFMKSFPG